MSKSTSEPRWLNSSPYASAYIRFASIPFREHPTSLEIPLKMDYISPSSPVLYSALCVSPLLAYFLYTHVIRGSRLPPSPPSDPIVGHVFRVPQSYAWKTYASWKKTLGKWIYYNTVTSIVSIPPPHLVGDVIYLHFYGSPMIVLNSISVARDLLDKRSLNSAGRPRQVVIGEMYVSISLPFVRYDYWQARA